MRLLIHNLLRKPLRTFLTATTVVLLTFTILTFASFGSSYGNRRRVEGRQGQSGQGDGAARRSRTAMARRQTAG